VRISLGDGLTAVLYRGGQGYGSLRSQDDGGEVGCQIRPYDYPRHADQAGRCRDSGVASFQACAGGLLADGER